MWQTASLPSASTAVPTTASAVLPTASIAIPRPWTCTSPTGKKCLPTEPLVSVVAAMRLRRVTYGRWLRRCTNYWINSSLYQYVFKLARFKLQFLIQLRLVIPFKQHLGELSPKP